MHLMHPNYWQITIIWMVMHLYWFVVNLYDIVVLFAHSNTTLFPSSYILLL